MLTQRLGPTFDTGSSETQFLKTDVNKQELEEV